MSHAARDAGIIAQHTKLKWTIGLILLPSIPADKR
jgi:hypothetical protein